MVSSVDLQQSSASDKKEGTTGLTGEEAKRRLIEYGYNEIEEQRKS